MRARCRVRLGDLVLQARALKRLERRRPLELDTIAGRLDRLRAGIERLAHESRNLRDAHRAEIESLMRDARAAVAAVREGAE